MMPPLPMGKRSRSERDAPRTSEPTRQQHLYLIFDDWDLGYSIRKLHLPNAGAEQRGLQPPNASAEQRGLPPPLICLEARRTLPQFFAAVGTKILSMHPRYDFISDLVPDGIIPIVDVCSRSVNFAPGEFDAQRPIFITVGNDELFALDLNTFKKLSMKPLCPPRLEHENRHKISEWSWCDLQMPNFSSRDVISYAVGSDGQTILASTAAATYAFDPLCHQWEKHLEWSLPFSGRAYFVPSLGVFVGLPKDRGVFGHLCFCMWSDDIKRVWFSKENLSSKEPAENHVGTTLVYLGQSRFCLVESVSIGDAEAVEIWLENLENLDYTQRMTAPMTARCRLTTFSQL